MGDKGSIFSTRIIAYRQNVDDQGRDLGEDNCILVMDKKLILLSQKKMKFETERSFDIEKMTLFQMDSKKSKSIIGRAIVGGAIAGGIGALIGGMTGTTKDQAWYCEIIDKDGSVNLFRLENNKGKINALRKWQQKHIKD